MRWYVKTTYKIGTGTEQDPYRPDTDIYPTATQWVIIKEFETYYVVKVYM